MSTYSPAGTKRAGATLVRKAPTVRPGHARTIALSGELGSGKTIFTQGLARALGIKEGVRSPTFVLMQPFEIAASKYRGSAFSRLWHVDCYRLKKPAELLRLGLRDILKDPANIVVVEWAERVKRLLPKDTTWIAFEHGEKENERTITVNPKS